MSKISDQMAAEQADIDAVNTRLDEISKGIADLDALIVAFQASPGTLSTADQAEVDKIQSAVTALRAKAAGVDTTPPAPGTPTTARA